VSASRAGRRTTGTGDRHVRTLTKSGGEPGDPLGGASSSATTAASASGSTSPSAWRWRRRSGTASRVRAASTNSWSRPTVERTSFSRSSLTSSEIRSRRSRHDRCLLRKETDDPDVARARRLIHEKVQHLVRLVDDLLDVSRISNGIIRLNLTTCEIGDVLAAGGDDEPAASRSRGDTASRSMSAPDRSGYAVTGSGWSRCFPTCSTMPRSSRCRAETSPCRLCTRATSSSFAFVTTDRGSRRRSFPTSSISSIEASICRARRVSVSRSCARSSSWHGGVSRRAATAREKAASSSSSCRRWRSRSGSRNHCARRPRRANRLRRHTGCSSSTDDLAVADGFAMLLESMGPGGRGRPRRCLRPWTRPCALRSFDRIHRPRAMPGIDGYETARRIRASCRAPRAAGLVAAHRLRSDDRRIARFAKRGSTATVAKARAARGPRSYFRLRISQAVAAAGRVSATARRHSSAASTGVGMRRERGRRQHDAARSRRGLLPRAPIAAAVDSSAAPEPPSRARFDEADHRRGQNQRRRAFSRHRQRGDRRECDQPTIVSGPVGPACGDGGEEDTRHLGMRVGDSVDGRKTRCRRETLQRPARTSCDPPPPAQREVVGLKGDEVLRGGGSSHAGTAAPTRASTTRAW